MLNANSPPTSVNPNSFNSGAVSQANASAMSPTNPDVSSGQFSVNNPQIGNTQLPQSNPITQNANSISTDILANASRGVGQAASQSGGSSSSGGLNVGKTIGSIGGSILGGPVGGAVGGFLGDIFGDLFAGGGPVSQGYAQGGQVSQDETQKAMALGYFIGALHQRDFGGTQDTLPQAADAIKQRLTMNSSPANDNMPALYNGGDSNFGTVNNPSNNREHVGWGHGEAGREQFAPPQQPANSNFASGGEVGNADAQLANQALMQALGLNTQTDPGNDDVQQQQQNLDTQTANSIQAANDLQAQPRGYMQQLAGGGPDTPPLQPGQTFQGDGSVKGPGGPADDAIPAKLSNGEFVMSAPSVAFFGVDKLVKMNEQGKQGYMEALGQVQQNQQKGPMAAMPQQGQPQMQQQPMALQQMPQQQPMKTGGYMQGNQNRASASNTKQGFMGL